jgi:Tfp pilus assembly protein PilO
MALNEQDKKTLQIGLFLCALILVGAVWAKFQIFSVTNTRTMGEIDAINAEVRVQQQLRNDLLDLRDRRDEIEALASRILLASSRLPSTREAREFYGELQQIVGTTQFDWNEFHPQRERTHQLYTEIPYRIAARSNYHEFGQFLNLIEENPSRFMRISRIDITNDRDRPVNHPVDVEITTFMLHDLPAGL